MWGVAFPREWIDVAWTSFGRRSDVVFFLVYIISLISHFTFRFTIHFTTNHYQKRSISGLLCRPCNSKTQHFLQVYYFWNFRHRLVRYYWYQLIKMKQRFPLHLDGDLGCRHDIGMTSWKLHLDGGKHIFSTQAWLRHEFRAFLYQQHFIHFAMSETVYQKWSFL